LGDFMLLILDAQIVCEWGPGSQKLGLNFFTIAISIFLKS